MKYAYFPGCSLHAMSSEFDKSTKEVCKLLGVELVEIPDWTCCGSTPAHSTDETLAQSLVVKNLVWPEKEGLDVLTPCASCFSRLKIANKEVHDDNEALKKVNAIIEENYTARVKVKHLLEAMPSPGAIKEKVKKTLGGLRVVCYYGCLLSRPRDVSIDEDYENPTIMDDLMEAAGADVLDWGYKTECCGASFALTETDVVVKLCGDLVNEARLAGAHCIVVACPMCHVNLDSRQKGAKMPVLYFTQLLGIALGVDQKKLEFDKHFVSPKEILKEFL